MLQLERPVEKGPERGKVGVLPRGDPGLDRRGGVTGHLGLELGRDAARLLPVGARHADQARVVALGVEGRLDRPDRIEELAERVVREHLVGNALHRGNVLGTGLAAGRGHHHVLIPLEQASRHPEIADVLQA